MTQLPTDRTDQSSVAEHVSDHNVLHAEHNELDGHAVDTTAVHGITDTSALETTTGSAAKVAAHEADTTSVHGIADTSVLSLTSHTHSGTYVALSTIDAAGDLLVGTANDTVGRLGMGAALTVLRVNAGATALEFAAPAAAGDMTFARFAFR